MKPYLLCPTCGSDDIMKNGTTRRGKQNYKCRDCGRQFVENPQWRPKDKDTCALIDRLLLERIPLERHFAVDKDSGLTSYSERLNNTLRQRISRLVRQSLAFSKKLENHIAAIWNFIHYYNRKIREKLQREQTIAFSLSFI